jgi:hypothetical protein
MMGCRNKFGMTGTIGWHLFPLFFQILQTNAIAAL